MMEALCIAIGFVAIYVAVYSIVDRVCKCAEKCCRDRFCASVTEKLSTEDILKIMNECR